MPAVAHLLPVSYFLRPPPCSSAPCGLASCCRQMEHLIANGHAVLQIHIMSSCSCMPGRTTGEASMHAALGFTESELTN